ncbi:MAG: CDP-alcohol phosphatidyltransferase family protein [Elusimicrobia bacterium]|nr:CDP-alcohol phosphatidyltransferase family protein [Elusimicrobiota bacterium]
MIHIHYKAYEIEEKLDLYFFHPLGALVAYGANGIPLTPNQLTYTSMALGILGGVLVYWPSLALWGVVMMVVSSIFDSADGQLARMQKAGSLKGRILDGMTGYFTFTAVHLALCLRYFKSHPWPESSWILLPMLLSGVSHSLQSCLYDFFRNQYIDYVVRRHLPKEEKTEKLSGFLGWAYQDYTARQRKLAAVRFRLEQSLRRIYPKGSLPDECVQAYRSGNRILVRGWNLMGDNLRFLYLSAAILLGRLEWYFYFAVVPLNMIMGLLLFLQARSDRRLMEGIK